MHPAKAVDSLTLALLQVFFVGSQAWPHVQRKKHAAFTLAKTYAKRLSQSLTLSVTCHAVSASRCTSRCPISPLVLEPSRICLVSLEAPVSTRSFDPSEFACSSCDELPTEFRSIPIFKPCAGTHCFDCLWPPRTTPWDEVLGPKSLRIE